MANYICVAKEFRGVYKNGQILNITITNGKCSFRREKSPLTLPPDLIVSSIGIYETHEVIYKERTFGIYRTKSQLTERVLFCIKEAEKSLFMSVMAILSLDDLILFLARQRQLDINNIEKAYSTLNKIKSLAFGTSFENEKKVAFSKAIQLSMSIVGIGKDN